MKKSLLVLFLLLFIFSSIYSYGQVAHVFTIDNDMYTITFSKNDNNYDFDLSMSGIEEPANFTLPKLDISIFKEVIYQKLDLLKGATVTRNDQKINEIFFTVVANIDTIDDLNYSPVAGTLKIGDEINLYKDKLIWRDGIKFKITNVQIVFQQGFIQDVIVDGKVVKDPNNKNEEEFENVELKFTNYYGIGFSSKK
ncbi:hypothetical protein AB9T88_07880, partial [Flavobacterium sp. LBUM151]